MNNYYPNITLSTLPGVVPVFGTKTGELRGLIKNKIIVVQKCKTDSLFASK